MKFIGKIGLTHVLEKLKEMINETDSSIKSLLTSEIKDIRNDMSTIDSNSIKMGTCTDSELQNTIKNSD